MRVIDAVGAVLLVAALALGGCGDSNSDDTAAIPEDTTFAVTAAFKTPAHPSFGVGSRTGLVVDGVEGAEITLRRNVTYRFEVDTPAHPVYFSTDPVGGAGAPGRITTGVVNDLIASGVIEFTPDDTLPDQFFYQCSVHDSMGWRVVLVP